MDFILWSFFLESVAFDFKHFKQTFLVLLIGWKYQEIFSIFWHLVKYAMVSGILSGSPKPESTVACKLLCEENFYEM